MVHYVIINGVVNQFDDYSLALDFAGKFNTIVHTQYE